MKAAKKTLWELLWDYDHNGLLVMDTDYNILVVNQALCNMIRKQHQDMIGRNAGEFFDDIADFRYAWESSQIIKAKEKTYPQYDLHVRKVIFPIKDEKIIACIMVDVTHEWRQQLEMEKLKENVIEQVNSVVDQQMKVAQEIAGLLGETTAETKVAVLKLVDMLKRERE